MCCGETFLKPELTNCHIVDCCVLILPMSSAALRRSSIHEFYCEILQDEGLHLYSSSWHTAN